MAKTFKNQKTEVKIGILEFLQKEQLNKILFEFKETTPAYLAKRNIDSDSLFPSGKLKTVGQVKKISPDHVLSLIGFGQEVSIPVEFLENVSLIQ